MQIITTERLIIREFTIDDNSTLASVLSDKEVMKYSFRGVCNPKEIALYIENCIVNYNKYGFGQWAVIEKQTNQLVGACGLNNGFDSNDDIVHINYRFSVNTWGKGFASEAVKAIMAYSRTELNIELLYALIEPENNESIRLALNQGFQYQKETVYRGRPLKHYIKSL